MNGDKSGNSSQSALEPGSNKSHLSTSYAYFGPSEGPLRSLPQRAPITVSPTTSVRQALMQMNQVGGDTIIVVDTTSELPLGIVTLTDLVHGISVDGGRLDEPIAGLMTGAPFSLPADAPSHRATVLMTKRGVRHVLLVEPDGRLCNVVSRSDLFGLRGGGAEALADRVTGAIDVKAMSEAADAIRKRGAELFSAGMGVEGICQWMSALNDLVVMRVIELVEDEFDLPPVPWCWLVFGSEGRLEQTFSTDQDNGLLFLPGDESSTEAIREAFLPFAKAVNRGLDACGFKHCKGGIMSGNPLWCLSMSEWQERFSSWMGTPDPEALMHSTIFFDFRPIYGSYELADNLRNWLIPLPPERPRFLRAMTEEALTCDPPLNWIGGFVYDGGREHPHSIDLKLHGARPFIDAARIWSLTHGIWATNTGDRLRAAAAVQNLKPEETASEIEAFHLIQRFRIQQQLVDMDSDDPNRLDPASLPDLNRLMLKEAFKQAKKLQLRLKLEYRL